MKPVIITQIQKVPSVIYVFFKDHLGNISAHMLGLVAIVLLHCASIPSLLAVLTQHTDKMPPVDIMIFIWATLITLFFKALIERNSLYIATISLGFAMQTVIMSLILFK